MNKQKVIKVLMPYVGKCVYRSEVIGGCREVTQNWPSSEVERAVDSVRRHVELEVPGEWCRVYRVSPDLVVEVDMRTTETIHIRAEKSGGTIVTPTYVPLYALLISPEDRVVLPDDARILLENHRHLLVAAHSAEGYFRDGTELPALFKLREQLEEKWVEPKLLVQLVGAPPPDLSRDRKTVTIHYVLPLGQVVTGAFGGTAYTEGFMLLRVEVPRQPSQRSVVMELMVGRAEEYEHYRRGEAKPLRASEKLVAAFTQGFNYEAAARKLFRESRDRVTA